MLREERFTVSTPHAILGILAESERHGYEMRRELEAIDPAWRLEFGQLYRLLAKLEGQGLVSVRDEASCGGPNRKCYRLTKKGHRELERWLAEPDSAVRPARDELPLKLIAGCALGHQPTLELVEERYRELEQQRTRTLDEGRIAQDEKQLGRWLANEMRLKHIDGSLAALASYIARVRRLKRDPSEPDPSASTILSAGSDDPLLELLGQHLACHQPPIAFTNRPVGSLAGLLALREGNVQLAGTHLIDIESGEYNVDYVKRMLIEEPVILVNLSYREQGLVIAAGNEKNIQGLEDLARPEIRVINRQQGAGTRLLLHAKLRQLDIDATKICGWDQEVHTHEAVAEAIESGRADVGMGVRAVAESFGLDFIPAGRERFDLALRLSEWESSRLEPLREALCSGAFRDFVGERLGYDLSDMGTVMARVE